MKTIQSFLTFTALLISWNFSLLAAPRTPAVGSPERVAICDALRAYLSKKVATRPLPQPVVFQIDHLRIDGSYAWFEGFPKFKNGGEVSEYLPDIDYNFVLQQSGKQWQVKEDLSRSDVPSDEEVVLLRKALTGVPTSIMPDFWRTTLKR